MVSYAPIPPSPHSISAAAGQGGEGNEKSNIGEGVGEVESELKSGVFGEVGEVGIGKSNG